MQPLCHMHGKQRRLATAMQSSQARCRDLPVPVDSNGARTAGTCQWHHWHQLVCMQGRRHHARLCQLLTRRCWCWCWAGWCRTGAPVRACWRGHSIIVSSRHQGLRRSTLIAVPLLSHDSETLCLVQQAGCSQEMAWPSKKQALPVCTPCMTGTGQSWCVCDISCREAGCLVPLHQHLSEAQQG
jgi:hypothetical protein